MKKYLFLIGGLISSWIITSQNLENQAVSYSDAAILFSNTVDNGTARFNAMGGAFGALGGDLSAMDINPAGIAVFKESEFGISFGVRNTDVNSSFYGNNLLNEDTYSDFTQGGGVLVFDAHRNSNWSKFAIGFNYSISKSFENNWIVQGSSPFTPLTDFFDPNVDFENAEEQLFSNFTNGKNDKYTFSFASELDNKLYIGAAITTHNLSFGQLAQAEELNSDLDGNTFDVVATQELFTTGSGVSFSAGIIAKPTQEVRLGISVQTPTWYSLTEILDQNDQVSFFNGEVETEDFLNLSELDYNITTPGKLTGSFAYIFGKQGLISFDYTYKDYANIKVRPNAEFSGENQDLTESLKGASEFRIGGEYRFDNVSLRGGYHFAESPFINAPNNSIKRTQGDTTGYSLGIGFKFGDNTRLDFAYQNSENSDQFKFQDIAAADPANLDITNDKFTATLVFGF